MPFQTIGESIAAKTTVTGFRRAEEITFGVLDPAILPDETGQLPVALYERRYGVGAAGSSYLGTTQEPGMLEAVVNHGSNPFELASLPRQLARVDHEDVALAYYRGWCFFETFVRPLYLTLFPPAHIYQAPFKTVGEFAWQRGARRTINPAGGFGVFDPATPCTDAVESFLRRYGFVLPADFLFTSPTQAGAGPLIELRERYGNPLQLDPGIALDSQARFDLAFLEVGGQTLDGYLASFLVPGALAVVAPAAAPSSPATLAGHDQRAEELRSLVRMAGVSLIINGKDALKDTTNGAGIWPVTKVFVVAAIRLYRRLMGTD